jgi:hypothetical protein
MNSLPRLAPAALAALALALALAGCTTLEPPPRIPPIPDAPGREISSVALHPASRAVLPVNEPLHVRFRYDLPEAPCQIFAVPGPVAERDELADHGFRLLPPSSPPVLRGDGASVQAITLVYDPQRDLRGESNRAHPPFFRATNLLFVAVPGTLAQGSDGKPTFRRDAQNARIVHSVPIDATWLCRKIPEAQHRQAREADGWRQVQSLYSSPY